MGWYNTVSSDMNKLPTAILFYEKELITAENECNLSGMVETAATKLPGLVAFRFNQLQETEAILRFLEINRDQLKASHYKNFMHNHNKSFTSAVAAKLSDGEADVVSFNHMINEFALIRNKYIGIIKSLDVMQWQVGNVTKLKSVGMDDAQFSS